MHKDGVYLTLDSFYKNRRRHDGLDSRCKDCDTYATRLNPDADRERHRRWKKRKRREAGVLGYTPGFRERLQKFAETGEYELPDADEAAERLRRFASGEVYRK